MHSLPADIARCGGWWGFPPCQDCARRNVQGMDRIVWMSPPDLVDGKCPMKIEAEKV